MGSNSWRSLLKLSKNSSMDCSEAGSAGIESSLEEW